MKEKVSVYGVVFDSLSPGDAASLVLGEGRRGEVVFTPNLEMMSRAARDESIAALLSQATVRVADGRGVLLLSHILGVSAPVLCPGIELGEELLRLASRRALGVYLLGGRQGVADRAAERLRASFPRLRVCGTHHGYFLPEDEERILRSIGESGAELLVVCLGFPRQESFALTAAHELPSLRAIACLGGSLDVWSGERARAPRALRALGLEWLWRVAHEPRRLPRLVRSASIIPLAAAKRLKNVILRSARAYNQTKRS